MALVAGGAPPGGMTPGVGSDEAVNAGAPAAEAGPVSDGEVTVAVSLCVSEQADSAIVITRAASLQAPLARLGLRTAELAAVEDAAVEGAVAGVAEEAIRATERQVRRIIRDDS